VVLPNELHARATALIVRDPHLVVSAARSDALLGQALERASQPGSPAELRTRVELAFRAPDQLHVQLRTERDERSARALANAMVELVVEHANASIDQRSADRARAPALAQARTEHERIRGVLNAALTREGYPDLAGALAAARTRLELLERAADEATTRISNLPGKLVPPQGEGREQAPRPTQPELAAAQRSLSLLLAEHGQGHPRVQAARERLERLQGQSFESSSSAPRQRSASDALEAEARSLALRTAQQRAELAQLQQVSARIAPLVASEEHARARLHELEAEAHGPEVVRSSVLSRAELRVVDRRALRVISSLLTGLVALLSLAAFFALGALRGFRVCAPTELAYWLGVPVLASSVWPRRPEALESLVDELADPALDARGVVLVLPLTEAERPLAATLCVQLNARAQRHYRSTTGSRVTIAQPWLGELGSSRIKRAAEAADRVLWVVAADAHRGSQLRHCRALVGRHEGVAAVLVDSEPTLAPRVGNAGAFWGSHAPAQVGRVQASPR